MTEMNIKSLILAIILGFASWFWAFFIVGSAIVDLSTGEPLPFDMGRYITMLIVNIIVTIVIIALYMWKYEQNNPIIPDKWAIDAIIFGAILCAMNFLLDAMFFGVFMGLNMVSYFWLETTTGYFYPLIIVQTLIIAWVLYGRNA